MSKETDFQITEEEKQMILLSRDQKKLAEARIGRLKYNIASLSKHTNWFKDTFLEFMSVGDWEATFDEICCDVIEMAFDETPLKKGTYVMFNSEGLATLDILKEKKTYYSAEESEQIEKYVSFGEDE